jgi:hypothetical protein
MRIDREQQPQTGGGQTETDPAAHERQHDALGQQLAQHPPTTSSFSDTANDVKRISDGYCGRLRLQLAVSAPSSLFTWATVTPGFRRAAA